MSNEDDECDESDGDDDGNGATGDNVGTAEDVEKYQNGAECKDAGGDGDGDEDIGAGDDNQRQII